MTAGRNKAFVEDITKAEEEPKNKEKEEEEETKRQAKQTIRRITLGRSNGILKNGRRGTMNNTSRNGVIGKIKLEFNLSLFVIAMSCLLKAKEQQTQTGKQLSDLVYEIITFVCLKFLRTLNGLRDLCSV